MAALFVSQAACAPSLALSRPSSAVKSSGTPALSISGKGRVQVRKGNVTTKAASEDKCSRRDAMVAGASGLTSLLFLLPTSSAEARTPNPGVRKKLREALDTLKKEAGKAAEETKETVEELTKQASKNVQSAANTMNVANK